MDDAGKKISPSSKGFILLESGEDGISRYSLEGLFPAFRIVCKGTIDLTGGTSKFLKKADKPIFPL